MKQQRAWVGRVTIGVSLDGFIARPNGDISWLLDPPAGRAHAHISSTRRAESWDTFFPTIDHIVMGCGTYETVAAFDEWPYDGKGVIVLSTTLSEKDDRIRVARSVEDAAAMLTDLHARIVYIDGGKTIQAFLRKDFIDEITTSWAPILLGAGSRLFDSLPRDVYLTLLGSHATDDGMVHSTYRVEHHPIGR
ncbi:dihydrofolate reductase [Microbacterium endophyticum]|uniref:Dihydrofolate reductase n=1 Tax=Microbacterium endophyticum TaxID=1526412 RepID=A0A7W4V380_9MICO|nr:dihydrofolate reductase family protein [Microbacterium endophyticum]MBB2975679.1 dihydrofolate reductase [Microbacterium endophyticum]NIK35302.1 dihydrofolate reductase [Microbacterium endophyticum]